MLDRTFKSGEEVSIMLPDGTLESGWRIFTVNDEAQIAILTKEVGSDIESKKVPLSQIR